MSSNLYCVNWTPFALTPTLNGDRFQAINPAAARDNYVPYILTIDRAATQDPPQPGVWCRTNELLIKLDGSDKIQRYFLEDPTPALADIDLWLWVFPDFIVFSLQSRQEGDRHEPNM